MTNNNKEFEFITQEEVDGFDGRQLFAPQANKLLRDKLRPLEAAEPECDLDHRTAAIMQSKAIDTLDAYSKVFGIDHKFKMGVCPKCGKNLEGGEG